MNADQHAEIRELIPAYALGSLDDDERAMVARHLQLCSACRAEMNSYEAVAGALALAVPSATPSPDVRRRLLREVHGRTSTAPRRQPIPRLPAGRRAWPVMAVVGLAAVVVGVLLWTMLAGLIPGQSSVTLRPTDFAPDATGELRFEGGDEATLEVSGLPVLPAGRQYQLWLVDDQTRDSGAIFEVNAAGWAEVPVTLTRDAGQYDAFGITVEPAGGSPGPTGERVLGSR